MKRLSTFLSTLYRSQVQEMQRYLELEAKASDFFPKSQYRVLASVAGAKASGLANCIATFGDVTCGDFQTHHRRAALKMAGVDCCSWHPGVDAVKEHIGGLED